MEEENRVVLLSSLCSLEAACSLIEAKKECGV